MAAMMKMMRTGLAQQMQAFAEAFAEEQAAARAQSQAQMSEAIDTLRSEVAASISERKREKAAAAPTSTASPETDKVPRLAPLAASRSNCPSPGVSMPEPSTPPSAHLEHASRVSGVESQDGLGPEHGTDVLGLDCLAPLTSQIACVVAVGSSSELYPPGSGEIQGSTKDTSTQPRLSLGTCQPTPLSTPSVSSDIPVPEDHPDPNPDTGDMQHGDTISVRQRESPACLRLGAVPSAQLVAGSSPGTVQGLHSTSQDSFQANAADLATATGGDSFRPLQMDGTGDSFVSARGPEPAPRPARIAASGGGGSKPPVAGEAMSGDPRGELTTPLAREAPQTRRHRELHLVLVNENKELKIEEDEQDACLARSR
jgi:hypothetical protein